MAPPLIAIVDYGMANLRSVQKALEIVGARPVITSDPEEVLKAEAVVFPGQGAFADAMENLRANGLDEALLEFIASGRPFLGICIGLQLLFEESEEMGHHKGLGVWHGKVVRFPDDLKGQTPTGETQKLKIPHIGWNQVWHDGTNPLLKDVPNGAYAYFVHSYYVVPQDESIVMCTTDYGIEFVSGCSEDNVWGIQFHPEKSQEIGRRVLTNFMKIITGGSN
jgi:glutamine amidotransferase